MPATATVTTAEKLQLPLAGMVLPLKPSVVPATVAATVPHAQVVAALAGLAMVMPLGRFDRQRWKSTWKSLFASSHLVRNNRRTVRIVVSQEQDGAFAVVDVDTLWRNRNTGEEQHWIGRACKVYTKTNGRWYFIHQTGLLRYGA